MSLETPSAAGAFTVASTSGIAGGLAMVGDVALQLFGVPLPVLCASVTGACGARVFLPPATFWRAFWSSTFWTGAGVFASQFVLWMASKWLDGAPPTGALAGIALALSAFGQRVVPILWDRGGAALERKLDQIWANKGDGSP